MFANSKKVTTFAPAIEREILDKKDGPFVYRLGRKIFILESYRIFDSFFIFILLCAGYADGSVRKRRVNVKT